MLLLWFQSGSLPSECDQAHSDEHVRCNAHKKQLALVRKMIQLTLRVLEEYIYLRHLSISCAGRRLENDFSGGDHIERL